MPNKHLADHNGGILPLKALIKTLKRAAPQLAKLALRDLADRDLMIKGGRVVILSNARLANPEAKLLTVKQALLYAPMSRSRLYELIECGKIKRRKEGRKTLIVRSSLDRYQASLR